MATWYVDFEGGNDANTGLSFAQRKQTISAVTPAAGDSVRVMATPDATSIGSATWNNLSKTITIPSGLTSNIDTGSVAWTASVNVTTATSATRKEGSTSASAAIAAAFTTGLVAFKTLSLTDFSAFQQVSYWVRANAAVASGALELRLCSDVAGLVTVNTIPIPQIANLNAWHAITFDNAGALGSTVQSVALYANTDPGTVTVLLDNILACKASSSIDSITLTTRIGKNTDNETFYAIQSINGTTVLLDEDPSAQANVGMGYFGATETVTTYIRKTAPIPTGVTADQLLVNASGTSGSPITYSGGWNRTDMSTQTGQSWIAGVHGVSEGISITSRSFITVSNLQLSRFAHAFLVAGTSNNLIFSSIVGNNNKNAGMQFSTSTISTSSVSGFIGNNNGGTGADIDGSNLDLQNMVLHNNATTGWRMDGDISTVKTMAASNNGTQGVLLSTGSSNNIYSLTTSNNGSFGIMNNGNLNYLFSSTLSEANDVSSNLPFQNYKVYSHKKDGVVDRHRVYMDGAQVDSETGTDRRTLSGMAWKLSPTSSNRSSSYPVTLGGVRIACASGTQVSVSVWIKRSNAGITASLFIRGGQLSGVPSDLEAIASGTAGVYEQKTLTFTPTEAGVIEVEFHAYGGTTFSAWFDDMTITQL